MFCFRIEIPPNNHCSAKRGRIWDWILPLFFVFGNDCLALTLSFQMRRRAFQVAYQIPRRLWWLG